MASKLTLIEKKNGVGIITLNRPAKLNALNSALTQEIHKALTEFEEADDVKVVIMTGAGERAFCAGARHIRRSNPFKRKIISPAKILTNGMVV